MGMGHLMIFASDRHRNHPGSSIRLFLDSSLDTISSQLTAEIDHRLIPKNGEALKLP